MLYLDYIMKLFSHKDKKAAKSANTPKSDKEEKPSTDSKHGIFSKKNEIKTEQEKVDERRAEVLSNGRKFKYPIQWSKHRVVVSTILIAVVVSAIIVVSGWLALYRFGMTDEMLFRATKIFPVPVATVDGEQVRFSDYLMFYRSSIISIERQSGQVENQGNLDSLRLQYKRAALDEAEDYTYAAKLAKDLGVTVSKEEIDNEFERHLKIGGVDRSEQSFIKIIEDNFGLNKDEYRHILKLTIMKSKVEVEIDDNASKVAEKVESMLASNGGNYSAVADTLGEDIIYEETGGFVSNQNIDGGRALEASKLNPGEQSGRFISMNGDGYYFVKLIKKTDTEVNFVSIKIPFTEFKNRMDTLRSEEKITEYVAITDNE